MVRIAALLVAPSVSAFAPLVHPHSRLGHVKASPFYSDDFDAPVLANPQSASSPLDHEIKVVDDECYLGKYGQYSDCVDFDPIHSAEVNKKAALEMPDFSKLGDEIFSALKNSPLGKLFAK